MECIIMYLEFEIENQIIFRCDNNTLVNKSRNYVHATFNFTTDDWEGVDKFAIFRNSKNNNFRVHLGDGDTCECIVPSEALRGDFFWVSVYGGDLITSNSKKINLVKSGYSKAISSTKKYDKDVFVQIFEKLSGKFEDATYENGDLIFYNILDNGTRDVVHRVPLHVDEDISENIKLSFTQLSNAIIANGL